MGNGSLSSRSFATRRADYFARKDVKEGEVETSSSNGTETASEDEASAQGVAEKHSPPQQ